ncbi:hypothetical protein [Heterosigma akashiwo virus 01]|jgi:hypothetical protein|uniref:Uncharacterized protein n=1 Tax=Heterosigma akashiwo virus 01 TaxID=97195 RepID=A0A1C9C5J5_HAV01|nr:hypothetical protein D1R72_gp233 [Heterosigma akashiwo virus 01]AOM63564.1 hypothetical protein [Heterosigma akashiwo virus 01]
MFHYNEKEKITSPITGRQVLLNIRNLKKYLREFGSFEVFDKHDQYKIINFLKYNNTKILKNKRQKTKKYECPLYPDPHDRYNDDHVNMRNICPHCNMPYSRKMSYSEFVEYLNRYNNDEKKKTEERINTCSRITEKWPYNCKDFKKCIGVDEINFKDREHEKKYIENLINDENKKNEIKHFFKQYKNIDVTDNQYENYIKKYEKCRV